MKILIDRRGRMDRKMRSTHATVVQALEETHCVIYFNHSPSVAGVTAGAAVRERSTVCRLVTSRMAKPLFFESVAKKSPLLNEICSDAITCSDVMPSTLTVYDSVTPDRSLRPLDVVVMSVTNASGTPSTEITPDDTALVKSTAVVSHNSMPMRVWVERIFAA